MCHHLNILSPQINALEHTHNSNEYILKHYISSYDCVDVGTEYLKVVKSYKSSKPTKVKGSKPANLHISRRCHGKARPSKTTCSLNSKISLFSYFAFFKNAQKTGLFKPDNIKKQAKNRVQKGGFL